MKESFFSSWSGGKDSSLALYKAIERGGAPKLLLTIFGEDGTRSRAHGFKAELIAAQSQALDIPFEIRTAKWGSYGEVFLEFLKEANQKGIEAGVFGDIDLESHRNWIEDIARNTGIAPSFPLWGMEREAVVKEFIDLGFEAVIVACKKTCMDQSFLGRKLDLELLEEFREMGVDSAGENGEYHTVVVNGPIFKNRIDVKFLDYTEDEKQYYLNLGL